MEEVTLEPSRARPPPLRVSRTLNSTGTPLCPRPAGAHSEKRESGSPDPENSEQGEGGPRAHSASGMQRAECLRAKQDTGSPEGPAPAPVGRARSPRGALCGVPGPGWVTFRDTPLWAPGVHPNLCAVLEKGTRPAAPRPSSAPRRRSWPQRSLHPGSERRPVPAKGKHSAPSTTDQGGRGAGSAQPVRGLPLESLAGRAAWPTHHRAEREATRPQRRHCLSRPGSARAPP